MDKRDKQAILNKKRKKEEHRTEYVLVALAVDAALVCDADAPVLEPLLDAPVLLEPEAAAAAAADDDEDEEDAVWPDDIF
jgi:hypothetical protein